MRWYCWTLYYVKKGGKGRCLIWVLVTNLNLCVCEVTTASTSSVVTQIPSGCSIIQFRSDTIGDGLRSHRLSIQSYKAALHPSSCQSQTQVITCACASDQ